MDARFPTISPVMWLRAREVLGGEARDFTPWLAQPEILGILGATLHLDELSAVAIEHAVSGKRLDILAVAEDENGDEIDVCIENQYGAPDADHLGRLIVYLAQRGRGRGIWVVEDGHDAFVAAVNFLNRETSEHVAFYLVRVRFTHGSADAFQVDFEVLAAPNSWERPAARPGVGIRTQQGRVWAEQLREHLSPLVVSTGAPAPEMHGQVRHPVIRIPWLATLREPLAGLRMTVRVTREATIVQLAARGFGSRAANAAAARILEEAYRSQLEERLGNAYTYEWGAGTGRAVTIRVKFPIGYVGGEAIEAAPMASRAIQVWHELLATDPVADLNVRVRDRVPDPVGTPDLEALGAGEDDDS